MISIKTPHEINLMKHAGLILQKTHKMLATFIVPGTTTQKLDSLAKAFYLKHNVTSAFKNYHGFPKHICTSVNEVVVHGIPTTKTILKLGDIITIDLGIYYKGYYADCACTYFVGDKTLTPPLITLTQTALMQGLTQIKPGNHFSDISYAIQTFANQHNLGIVKDFTGHGIGTSLHEEPYIPNFGQPHQGAIFKEGMTFCVEPMLTLGSPEIEILVDNWTVVTTDKSLSAHFEHTVVVTNSSYEILA
ncbi:type I methionyl aminopeptidase [Candidatus Phytoplasma solani]|uniref:Methionine aminopeptidase n=1 Tax=Candidatus Phytoplasma solani TaxID=69896 RepID=B5WYN0_9MOLU|nr:type I methionyl aminopeptidase [Candidatus Phytoplasma solani]RMI88838.1 methionine aminopeptidase [Candidatus Phytoplasma solani]CAQ48416.1 methionine aminopeptidase [Candidatus Phytoplasma solani]CAQ48418.1 methionine aminopeptidase [Candidatus Phytoplasma solani]CAQ48420.1 methionine aminopeptidase [Candidatus Phytoplasma solani]CAQ48422.1 methionine aminopeptidase [Candidatus Phytoplasma solani]